MGKSLLLTAFGIFVVLCGNELGFHLSGGEEQYLAFAKQYMDPAWVEGSFTLTEFAGTRILFQILVGSLLKYLDFAHAVFVLRLASYAGMAYAMGRMLVRLNFSWYWSLVITQLFVMSNQSFFGMEWIVQSFEPKVIAYIFVFMALGSAVTGRMLWVAAWLGIATWFHFLVGGWMAICFGLYAIWSGRSAWIRTYALPYCALVLPLVLYLYSGYFRSPPVDTEFDLDWVYCYYRLPHHLGLFNSMEFFVERQLAGVVASVVVLIAAIGLRKLFTGDIRMFQRMLVIALAINLIFVGVAWVDQFIADHAFAGILKFYPFRLSGFALYTSILLAGWLIWKRLEPLGVTGKRIRLSIAVLVVILGAIQVINHVEDEFEPQYTAEYLDVTARIRLDIDNAVFALINQPMDSEAYNAFIRLTGKESFTVKKFVPGEKYKLDEWYRRQMDLIRVNNDNASLPILKDRYGVTHILSPVPVDGYQLVYRNDKWLVYGI